MKRGFKMKILAKQVLKFLVLIRGFLLYIDARLRKFALIVSTHPYCVRRFT